MSAHARTTTRRDRGSVLPLVLVFMVIGTLVVVPMMTYASTILRANSVAIQRTETMEQLRGGARVAAADPQDLFVRCATGAWTSIPVAGSLVPGTTSMCRRVAQVAVLDELEVPFGGAVLQLGETIPTGFSFSTVAPDPADPVDWYGDLADGTSCAPGEWCREPKEDTIWLPALPEVATSVQESGGYPMPAPRDCTVYFPGTYDDPVVIDRPTYFVSGVYLFNETVTVVGGADAVFGFGLAEGCVGNDAAAVLDMYPNPLPPHLNAEGNGATLMFADEARLIIDDSSTTDGGGNLVPNSSGLGIRFEINQRYVQDVSDTAARVAILSVNGDQDVDDTVTPAVVTNGDLLVPDVITVAESVVQTSQGALVRATDRGLVPSSLTPEPRAPDPPTNIQASIFDDDPFDPYDHGAARISWDPQLGTEQGGSTVTQYVVTDTADPSLTCSTDGATSCVVRDLEHAVDHAFTVTATNDLGTSEPSAPSNTVASAPTSPDLGPPDAPTDVTVADPTTWLDEAEVSWTASAFDGNGELVGYVVEAYRAYEVDNGVEIEPAVVEGWDQLDEELSVPFATCETRSFRDDPAPTSCVVTGLAPLDTTWGSGPVESATDPFPTSHWLGYVFRVRAVTATTNEAAAFDAPPPAWEIGASRSAFTATPIAGFTGAGPHTPPEPPTVPVAPPYVPDPIVDIALAGSGTSVVTVAGYVAVPQGRVRVANPTGQRVSMVGGLAAGSVDVDAATAATMGYPGAPTEVGFENVVLQRTVEILTQIPGVRMTSTVRAQINANAADMIINSWVIQ